MHRHRIVLGLVVQLVSLAALADPATWISGMACLESQLDRNQRMQLQRNKPNLSLNKVGYGIIPDDTADVNKTHVVQAHSISRIGS